MSREVVVEGKRRRTMDRWCRVVLVWPKSWIGVRVLLSLHVHLDIRSWGIRLGVALQILLLCRLILIRKGEVYKGRGREGHPTVDKVEKVLANLTTSFSKVHSRQCKDEAELAEHVVGLTCSLSSCLFRKKLTRLDVNANGSFITKDCVDRHLIKKSSWLKALVAIPKVQPRFAIAIGKKYPTMKSLLSVYMDPNISVHDKEFLLKDLMTEGLLGGDRRLGEVCSKRVYRILMAQSGCTKTDDVEDGADFFRVN